MPFGRRQHDLVSECSGEASAALNARKTAPSARRAARKWQSSLLHVFASFVETGDVAASDVPLHFHTFS
jgi:hypothetical protein